jgi:hypothetical protein
MELNIHQSRILSAIAQEVIDHDRVLPWVSRVGFWIHGCRWRLTYNDYLGSAARFALLPESPRWQSSGYLGMSEQNRAEFRRVMEAPRSLKGDHLKCAILMLEMELLWLRLFEWIVGADEEGKSARVAEFRDRLSHCYKQEKVSVPIATR